MPVVLRGCETWSLTLWKECRLRVFGKQGAEDDIWAQKRRSKKGMEKTTYAALCSLLLTIYYSVGQIIKNEMVRACSTY
jgi:hypothetical protein